MAQEAVAANGTGGRTKPRAVVIPFPLQGHVIPAAHLALRLAARGFAVTFVNTESVHQQMAGALGLGVDLDRYDIFAGAGADVRYELVSDGFRLGFDRSLNHDQYMEGVLHVLPAHVEELLRRVVVDPASTCLVADTFFVSPATLARKLGVPCVSFWTQPALSFALYHHMDLLAKHGHFKCKEPRKDTITYIPGVPAIEPHELMSFLQETDTTSAVHRIIFKSFEESRGADYVLCNTVEELEPSAIAALRAEKPLYAVGPIFPAGFTRSAVATSMWAESDCSSWLDAQPAGFVLYISFGSYAHVTKQDLHEIAGRASPEGGQAVRPPRAPETKGPQLPTCSGGGEGSHRCAIRAAEPFLCKHVLEMNRPTLQKTVFTNITDISADEMCEVNWNIFKEIRFYYLLNKDEDFYELYQFFVHRVREEDLSLLMECTEIENVVHGACQGMGYSVLEPDDEDYMYTEVHTDTDFSQEMLVDEIRKFVKKSVARRELRRSIRKQGRKSKTNLLLKGGCEEAVDVAPRATSRYCLSYFLQVIKSVRDSQRKSMLVAEMGFGEIIHLDDCIVPRSFAQWLADACTFGDDGSIIIQNAVILNPDSVQDTFAIPSGSATCSIEEEEGKLAFLAQFALSDLSSLKYFGNMIMNDELPADVFKRAFMTVALGTFLCPTSSTKPSTKYLGALVDVECLNNLNWCKIVHDWLLCYLKKYHKDKKKGNKVSITLGGCIYHLAVKNISETCYIAKSYIESSSHVNGNLSDRINSIIGNFIPQKVFSFFQI
ncbi:hypothetical protein ACQ4PT_051979 [Festuca glaucescens]